MADLAQPPMPAGARTSADASSGRRSSVLPDLPYPGIRPFKKEEWPIFCGRQRIVDDLLRILGEARFLPVLGTSGCGKSSLIKAGVIATLERECGRMGARWRTAEMRPANAPMWGLAEALWAATHPDDRPGHPTSPPEEIAALRAILGRGPGGIARVLETYAFPSDHNLLLHVDQFEELFRFRSLSSETEAEDFVDQLIDVFDAQPRGIYVVATMRTDFIADCAHFPRLADAFNQTGYLLRRMTEGELREAIERPARLYRGRIEPQLIDRLVRDGGREQDQLPVIEHALMWMWIRAGKSMGATLTLDDYLSEEVGGIEGALSRHADQIYGALHPSAAGKQPSARDLRPVAKRLFQALSDTDRDGRVIRRPVPFGELCSVIGASSDDVAHVIDEFRKPSCSFLMPPYGKALDGKTVIDVSHEALIRQWSKMKGANGTTDWVEQEKKDGDNWQALAREARKFETNPRLRLRGDQSTEYQTWWRSREPNAAWSRRYTPAGEDLFEGARKLLQKSETRRRIVRAAKWASASSLFFLGFLAIAGTAYFTAERQNRLVVDQAQSKEREAKLESLTARSLNATSEWQTTDGLALARDALVLAREAHTEDSDVGAEAAAYAALARHRTIAEYGDVSTADVSPDGEFAVLGGEGPIRIVDLSTMTAEPELRIAVTDIDNIAVAPGGTHVAVSYTSQPSRVEIWDLKEKEEPHRLQIAGSAPNLWFSPDGRWVGLSDDEGAKIVEVSSGKVSRWPQEFSGRRSLVFSPDSRYVATAAKGGDVVLLRLEAPFESKPRVVPGSSVGIAAFDPSGKWLAVPTVQVDDDVEGSGGEIVLIDIETDDRKILASRGDLRTVAFSADGKWLALGSNDGSIDLFDTQGWRRSTIAKFDGAVRWLASSPRAAGSQPDAGPLLAVASDDGLAHVLQIPSGREVATVPTGGAFGIAFADAGQRILTMGDDFVVRVWRIYPAVAVPPYSAKVSTGSPLPFVPRKECAGTTGSSAGSKASPQSSYRDRQRRDATSEASVLLAIDERAGRRLVLAARQGRPTILDSSLPAGSTAPDVPAPDWFGRTESGAFDRVGQGVVVDANGRLLDMTATGDREPTRGILEFSQDVGDPVVLGIDADGRVLAVRGDSWIELSATGEPSAERTVPGEHGCNLAVDADRGRVLKFVAGKQESGRKQARRRSDDGGGQRPRLLVVNVTLPEDAPELPPELPLIDPNDPPSTGAFSPNGQFVAVVHQSRTVSVWDIGRRVLVARFGEPSQQLIVPGFTLDGNNILVGAADGSVYEWRLFVSREALLRQIDAALPRTVLSMSRSNDSTTEQASQ